MRKKIIKINKKFRLKHNGSKFLLGKLCGVLFWGIYFL
jgi:hypothetical protein